MSDGPEGGGREVITLRHSRSGALRSTLLLIAVALVLLTCTAAKKSPLPADPERFSVAAYGDSMTLGFGLPGGWPSALPAQWIHYNGGRNAERGVPMIDQNGVLTRTGTQRPITSPDLITLSESWDVVVLMWGTNDVLDPGYEDDLLEVPPDRPDHITQEDLMSSLEGAALTLRASGLRVVVAWPPPILPGHSTAEVANTRLQRIIEPLRSRLAAQGVSFVDLFTAFEASPSLPDPSIYYLDDVHWNEAGDTRAAGLIAAAIEAGCVAGFTGTRCETNIDECSPDPCRNGGACTDGVASFTCACPAGFTGATCETNVDDCSPDPCQNGGACTDGVASFTCSCPAGFSGATCGTNIDECASQPCENGGTCTDGVASFTCACPAGFTGATCETNVDDCSPDPCQNGGTCTDGLASFTCSCPTGFAGATCETNVDDCSPGACENGGTCTDGVASFTCSCPTGFTGATCETNIDECASQPCANGGTCTDGVASFTCACPAGFTGATCETNVDDCSPDPCQNGGTCTDGVASFTCSCPIGFTGATCETNIDECASQPCANGGTCTDGVASFTCACPAGFTGATCETNVDDCFPDPCQSGGACTDGVASFTCSCPIGFTGATCETNADDCSPDSCKNGGTCIDGVASFACACPTGFTGATCETNVDDCSPGPCENGGTCADGVESFTCSCPTGFTGARCETTLAAPPAAPDGVSAVATSATTVEIHWQDMSGNEAVFDVERSIAGQNEFTLVGQTSPNTTTYVDGTASGMSIYTYRVAALNSEGRSRARYAHNVTTPPDCSIGQVGPLENLEADDASDGIQLSWDPPACPVDHYEIFRGYGLYADPPAAYVTIPGNSLGYLDADVFPDTVHYYWVRAVNAEGTAGPMFDSNFVEPTRDLLPVWGMVSPIANPNQLRATAGNDEVTLSWSASTDPEVIGYNVWRTTSLAIPGSDASFDLIATISDPQTTEIDIQSLTNLELQYFRITAVTATGEGSLVSAGEVVTRPREIDPVGEPPRPGTVVVTPESGYHVKLTWEDGDSRKVPDLSAFAIYRKNPDGSEHFVMKQSKARPSSATVPVTSETTYSFTVRAVDREGLEGEATAPASATVPAVDLSSKVLVLYNSTFMDENRNGQGDSEEVARHYQAMRGIGEDHMLGVAAKASRIYTYDDRNDFYDDVIVPVQQRIRTLGVENVYYIAVCYGMPLYVSDRSAAGALNLSIDKWLGMVMNVGSTTIGTLKVSGFTSMTVNSPNARYGKLRYPWLYPIQDLPQSVNDIETLYPQYTMLFDHTVKYGTGAGPIGDVFLVSHVDGFDVQHAKELVDRAVYAEKYLSPEPGYYHGDGYIDRGPDFMLRQPLLDMDDDGVSENLTEQQIRDHYPHGYDFIPDDQSTAGPEELYVGGASIDFDWAWFDLFLRDRGWNTFTEQTPGSIGAPDTSFTNGESAFDGPPTLAQWYVGTTNNLRAYDKWKLAIGAVGSDFSSFGFRHPKDPQNTIPGWTGDFPDAGLDNFGFGAMLLYRGITAFSGAAEEPGYEGGTKGDILIGYMIEGFPFADAAARMRYIWNLGQQLDFGDPIYSPFKPGKVAAIDTTAPPLPSVTVVDDTVDASNARATVRWTIPSNPGAPDLVMATLEYGETSSLGLSKAADDADHMVFHTGGQFELDHLTSGATYYYRLVLTDPVGNVTISPMSTFRSRDAGNLLSNGDFETDVGVDRRPDAWAVTGSPRYFSSEFLSNGGFEIDDDGDNVPDGWSNNGLYSVDGAESADGQRAYRTSGGTLTSSGAGLAIPAGGSEFRLTAKARRATNSTGALRIGMSWTAPAEITSSYTYQTLGWRGYAPLASRTDRKGPWEIETTYTTFEIRGRIPTNARGLKQLVLQNVIDGASGDIWYDDVRLAIENPNAWGGYGSVGVVGSTDTVSQTVPVTAGASYAFSAKVRRDPTSNGAGDPRVLIEWLDASAAVLAADTATQSGTTATAWADVALPLVAPVGATAMRATLMGSGTGSDRFWFDQADLR